MLAAIERYKPPFMAASVRPRCPRSILGGPQDYRDWWPFEGCLGPLRESGVSGAGARVVNLGAGPARVAACEISS